jgi:ComF family protein
MATHALLHALAPLIDAIYPPRCPLCGEMLAGHQGLCGACWARLEFPGDPACGLCSRPLRAGRVNDALCAFCAQQAPAHQGVSAATVYNDASRQLVLAFKHGGRIALSPMLAQLMAARLRRDGVGADWLIVPVPLHRWRIWARGYNQSALLARDLARLTGGTLMVDALVRRRRTPSLGTLSREEREKAVAGAIGPRVQVTGARVLLVDDVLTSGATTNACIAALQQAGAAEVRIACFARVMSGVPEAMPAHTPTPHTPTPHTPTPHTKAPEG